MRNFKAQLEEDLKHTFFNLDEFSEQLDICINDEHCYRIPGILETISGAERKSYKDDYAEGFAIADVRLSVMHRDLQTMPKINTEVQINNKTYFIVKTDIENRLVILQLKAME